MTESQRCAIIPLLMKIQLAKSAGFCFGVRRALDIAFKTAKSHTNVQMLGDIVHNEDVIKAIKKAGIKKIKRLTHGLNKTLLIRAHGSSTATLKKAMVLGYAIMDATCPKVKEIHGIAKEMERKDYQIIIIGDKEHDEVQGIMGQLKGEVLVIDSIRNIPFPMLTKIKRAAVVVQSTQNLEKVLKIVDKLKARIENLKFFNTICGPTRIKQAEIKLMPLENDMMIILGSKTSANTRRLYEISKALNRKTYWVQSKKDIKPEWLKSVKRVGVTAGASTPESTTQETIAFLKKL